MRFILCNCSNIIEVPCDTLAKMKKGSSSISIFENPLPTSCNTKSRTDVSCEDTCFQRVDQSAKSIVSLATPNNMDISPGKSDGGSVFLDETMTTCDSLRSPEFEYIDNYDPSAITSIERRACSGLSLLDHVGKSSPFFFLCSVFCCAIHKIPFCLIAFVYLSIYEVDYWPWCGFARERYFLG